MVEIEFIVWICCGAAVVRNQKILRGTPTANLNTVRYPRVMKTMHGQANHTTMYACCVDLPITLIK